MLWPFFAAHPIIALSMWINWSRQATQAHASLYADCGNTPNMRLWCKLSTPLVKDRFQYPVSDRLKKTVNAVFYFLLWSTKAQRQTRGCFGFSNIGCSAWRHIVWKLLKNVPFEIFQFLIFFTSSVFTSKITTFKIVDILREFATFVLIFVTQVFWRENHNF